MGDCVIILLQLIKDEWCKSMKSLVQVTVTIAMYSGDVDNNNELADLVGDYVDDNICQYNEGMDFVDSVQTAVIEGE